ncbi:hypothetical protein CTEN210_18371 [Chaetoceros tenuissimus]|uniref:Leucine-rich repeat domain-containing protein n=1 Tax=Chaetoceros tenuissimus TaxID=426638 RepID=A0AAD3HFM9_9STRA|nr:hypothetical protein CTEN210_18371 [Chaetoceros tenuissimus]
MRVQMEEWRRFIPGVRMYKGKKTLFYNGEKLFGILNPLIYDKEERNSWEVIIVLPGVRVIPYMTFYRCENVKTVIMANNVERIERSAYYRCYSLVFVKLSTSIESIGAYAFLFCESLNSIFVPVSCREIDICALDGCSKLIILSVPQHTTLYEDVIANTALIKASPFDTNVRGRYENDEEVNEWIKNRLADNQFSLHRACASYNPLEEVIYDIVKRRDLKALKSPDSVGVTPSQYLSQNPFTDIKEEKIMKHYILRYDG